MDKTKGLMSPLLQEIRFNQIIKHIRGNSILDAGCGSCALAKKLPAEAHYLGVDRYSASNQQTGKKIKYLQVDLEKKFLLDKKFDTIILGAVVEHLHNPSRVLKNLSGHLKSGGIIIITTPTKFGIKLHKLLSSFGITSEEAAHEHTGGIDREDFLKFQKVLGLHLIKYGKFLFGLNQLAVFKKSPGSIKQKFL